MNSLFGMDPARLAMGEHALHMPINMIFQNIRNDNHQYKHAGVFQMDHPIVSQLIRHSSGPHVLVVADMFIRPQLVISSSHLEGHGIGGIYTDGFSNVQEWVEHGTRLFPKGELS